MTRPGPPDQWTSQGYSNEALLLRLPQHLPQLQIERRGDSQKGIQGGHPHPALHEGHGLLGQAGASCHLIHGQPEAFPPFT